MSLPRSFSVLSLCFQGASKIIPAKWSSCSASIPIFKTPAHHHTPSCFVCLTPSEFSLWCPSAHIASMNSFDSYLCILTVFLKCFISACFDLPKVLVNLMRLGRMMLTSLCLIKPGTVRWTYKQAPNIYLLKTARCFSVLTVVRKIEKGELGSMINWGSYLCWLLFNFVTLY